MSMMPLVAYIDPGSLGTILYSTALSMGIGILFFFRRIKQRIGAMLLRRRDTSGDARDE